MFRFFGRLNKNQSGITGLETAIILIAFVMVSSVLAYVVISAGLFSSQKAKEAVYSGLEEARSTLELKGSVLAKLEGGYVNEVYFTVSVHPSSEAIDFTDTTDGKNVVIIAYSDTYQQYPMLDWTMTKLKSLGDDNLLEPNELFQVCVDMSTVNDGAASDDEKLGPYRKFLLEVKPPKGAILAIERTVPARVSAVVNLN